MKLKLNAEWHKKNRMPKNPSFEQRVEWHAEHVKHCARRKPEGEMLEELKKRGLLPSNSDTPHNFN